MPRRSVRQKRGDFALANVIKVCSEHGWICDTVGQDYGEDISIQATVNGLVDSFRIWIQVKGYNESSYYRKRNGDISVYFDRQHLLKWLRSLETVIIVLYDQDSDSILWCSPQEQFRGKFLSDPFGSKGSKLLFEKSDEFNLASLSEIEWAARLDYYSKSIAIYEYYEHNFPDDREIAPKLPYSVLLAFTFGVEMGLFNMIDSKVAVEHEFSKKVLHVRDRVLKGELEYKEIKTFIILSVIKYINERTGNPVDEAVISKISSGVTLLIFGIYDLDNIRKPARSRFRRKKYGLRRANKRLNVALK